MRYLLRYLKGYTKECILAPLFKFLEAAFQLLTPLVVAQIIDRSIATGNLRSLLAYGLLLLLLAVVGLSSALTAQFFSAKLAAHFGTALRDDLFVHMLTLSQAELDDQGAASLVTRLTNDTLQIQAGVNMFFRLILRSPFVVIGCMIMAFLIDGTQGLIFTSAIAILSVIIVAVMRVPVRRYTVIQKDLDGIHTQVQENLTGVRSIRAFRREKAEEEKFERRASELYFEQLGVGRIAALMNPLTYIAINFCLIAVIATGAIQVNVGTLTQGSVIALINYVAQILVELIKFVDFIVLMARSFASLDRVVEIFELHNTMREGTRNADRSCGRVVCKDVSFTYPKAASCALADVDFVAEPGQTVGVIGGTGSGKTTLASLILRRYDPSSGSIEVGGHDIADYTIASYRRLVGIVDQDVRLFSGTIADNLRWGSPAASDDELLYAVELAQALDIVNSRKEGLAARVEEQGQNFSGGQKQRLSIARSLVGRPRVLILDDASSALDFATEARLRRVLTRELTDTTKIIISQRISAIRHADVIVVLDDGRQVGRGTHEELLAGCAVYQQICASQLSEEELIS